MAQDLQLRIKANIANAEKILEDFLAKWNNKEVNFTAHVNDGNLKSAVSELKSLETVAAKAAAELKNLNGSKNGTRSGSRSSVSKQLFAEKKTAQKLEKVWSDLEKKRDSLQQQFNSGKNNGLFNSSELVKYQNQINSLGTAMKQVADLRDALYKTAANGGKSPSLLSSSDRLKTNSNDFLTQAEKSISAVTAKNDAYIASQKAAAKAAADSQKAAEAKAAAELKAENEAQRAIARNNNQIIAFDKVGNRLTEYYGKYGTQLQKNIPILEKYQTLVNRVNMRDFGSTAELNQAFAKFRISAREAGVEVDTFATKLEKTFGSRVRSAMAGYGVFAIQSAVQDMIDNAIKIDTSLTELKKVTDATDSEYSAFMDNATIRAEKLGASLNDVVSATADYARLGYDIESASKLADASLLYLNVGDDVENIDQASKSLISTMQGLIKDLVKQGELLETPQSLMNYSVVRNNGRERLKIIRIGLPAAQHRLGESSTTIPQGSRVQVIGIRSALLYLKTINR